MKHEKSKFISAAVAVSLWLLVLGGCGISPPQRFYTLAQSNGNALPETRSANMAYSIVIGPVTVPTLVDRPQMVLNAGPNRVTLQEQARWAEPLKESIPRILAEDVSRLLPDAYVSVYPQAAILEPDFRVSVDVQRFDSIQGEAAIIDTQWIVSDKKGGTQSKGRTFKRESVQGKDYEDLVAAHRRAIAALSGEIASVIKEKAKARQSSGAGRPSMGR